MPTSLEVVIPVLNEQDTLASSTGTVYRYLSTELAQYDWRILIADNGSSDSTPDIAERLSSEYANVRVIRLEERGRGRAVGTAWLESDADIAVYMDVDLSTELDALPRLVAAIERDGNDIAIASRLKRGAGVVGRPPHREFISRVYSLLVRGMFWMGIRDYQCGCKAISRNAARQLLPLVEDTGWFFDTELLILSHKNGYRISEVPVRWTDDPDSRVRIFVTALEDLKGLIRLRFGGLRRASRILSGLRH